MQAGPWLVLTTWACDVRRVVSEYGTVLVVAVRTAVTGRQSDAMRDDQEDAHLTQDVGLGGRRDPFKRTGVQSPLPPPTCDRAASDARQHPTRVRIGHSPRQALLRCRPC